MKMRWFLVTLFCAYASAEYRNFYSKPQSAASEAQIKFAIENNYDDTGPGAKQREAAYNTYKTLDEALISYLNDPDTKLPEFEKYVAVNKLLKSNKYTKVVHPYLPKQVIDFQLKPLEDSKPLEGYELKPSYDMKPIGFGIKQSLEDTKPAAEFGIKPTFEDAVHKKEYWNFKETLPKDKITFLKSSPVNLGFYSREGDSRPVTAAAPLYSLVYDVKEKRNQNGFTPSTGQGDYLRGYYSLKDGDGKTRVIQYTVNHKGYSASERRIDDLQ